MGNERKQGNGSRRWFFSRLLSPDNDSSRPKDLTGEKVKMLTADGKLVEVDKAILEKATRNKKASNKEIFHWMKNPSKDNS